jgi:predicted acylesterase/phospholipase RssA
VEKLASAVNRGTPLSVGVGAGGVRSLAGLGVLRALRDNGADIRRLSGSSFGALVATAFAFGVPDEKIISAVESMRLIRLIRPAWRGRGLLSHQPVLALLRKILPDADLKDSPLPVSVWCTDLVNGAAVEHDRGHVCETVLASSLFAGLFDPVILDGRVAVDGGYTASVPHVAIQPDEHGLCIDVRREPVLPDMSKASLFKLARWRGIGSLLSASSDTLFGAQRVPSASGVCTVFRPELSDMAIANFAAARRAVRIGAEAVALGLIARGKELQCSDAVR